jgi:hypothetical protein
LQARDTFRRTGNRGGYGRGDGAVDIRFPERNVELCIEADPVFGHLTPYADPRSER